MINRAGIVTYPTRKVNAKGFTLLEVLLAIAIFSVISLSSLTLFDTILSADENSQQRSARQNELQRAFLLMERDFLQIARRSTRFNGEPPLEKFIHTDSSSGTADSQTLGFVRGGWTNPGLLLPRSNMQAVSYQLNEKRLERLHFNFVDAVVGQEPKVRPLISGVEQLVFEFYDGKKWQKKLENKKIPLAIAIELTLEDYGLIRRQFLVAGDFQGPDNTELNRDQNPSARQRAADNSVTKEGL
jgi:general secretion pathway protein J